MSHEIESKEFDESYVGKEKTPAERRLNLPAHLRLTPEREEELRRENAELLAQANLPAVRLSPVEQMRVRGIREEEEWRRALEQIDMALGTAITSGGADIDIETLRQQRQNASDQLAEALAAQGRFGEAAGYSLAPGRRAELENLWRAVIRPDDEVCGDECQHTFSNDPTLLSRERVVADVYSVVHGRVMPAVACAVCGALNVRSLPADIARQRAARSQARAIGGTNPAEEAVLLSRAGLTSKEIFG